MPLFYSFYDKMGTWNKNIVSDTNKKAIERYIEQQIANGNDNKETLDSHRSNIKRILVLINKDYNKVTKADMTEAFSKITSSKSRELAKIKFKSFLKFHNRNTLAKHIIVKSSVFKKPTKTEDDIITEEEINKLRNAPISIRNKAMIELFLTTGIRRGELVNLKLQNVSSEKDEIIVKITNSKTKPRNISIIPYPDNPTAFYPNNLISYIENHQFKEDTSKPLFFSMSTRAYGEKMNRSSLTLLFRTIQKKAKLTKKLTPHIFRHTAASNDGYHYTTGELELKYGWNPGSDMAKIYCHLSEIRMNEHLKRKAGLTPELVEKESKCPYCGAVNNINAIHCHNCKHIINRDELIKRAKLQEKRDQQIAKDMKDIKEDNERLNKRIDTILAINLGSNQLFNDLITKPLEKDADLRKSDKTEFIKRLFSDPNNKPNNIKDIMVEIYGKENANEFFKIYKKLLEETKEAKDE